MYFTLICRAKLLQQMLWLQGICLISYFQLKKADSCIMLILYYVVVVNG